MIVVSSRDVIREKQRASLIEALKRFGYTHCSFYDGRTVLVFPSEIKPYDLFIDNDDGALIIVHRQCTECLGLPSFLHNADFLKEMVPVIGRLDAQAHYDPGVDPGRGQRLRIFL